MKSSPPAFPCRSRRFSPSTGADADVTFEGISALDYFAAAALTGLLSHPSSVALGAGGREVMDRFAAKAYDLAEAMEARRTR